MYGARRIRLSKRSVLERMREKLRGCEVRRLKWVEGWREERQEGRLWVSLKSLEARRREDRVGRLSLPSKVE